MQTIGHAVWAADTQWSMSPTPSASAPRGADAASIPSPRLLLRVEAVLVPDGDPLLGRVREERAAVGELIFDYPAGAPRDLDEERRARYLLESLGALELACLDDITAFPGSKADYIIRADGNVHGLCSFTAYAVPQLRGARLARRPADRVPVPGRRPGRSVVRARR